MSVKKLVACNIAAALCCMGARAAETNAAPAPVPPRPDPYYAVWSGWEARPLLKARRQAEIIFKSDFSPAGLARWWIPDGVMAESSSGGIALKLAPEEEAAGGKWGILWSKHPVMAPCAIEVEFTLAPDCPRDVYLFWGQNAPSKRNLGGEQECYLAGYFGWGGKCCGIERTSDWLTFGITGAAYPVPGMKHTAIWIVDGKTQCMYLDGILLLYTKTDQPPPLTGYFGLGIYMSRFTCHSVKAYKLNPMK